MFKVALEIRPVASHCELEAFLGYLGKTHMGFKCPEGWGILSFLNFCSLNHFLTPPVSAVAGIRSTKNLPFCWPAREKGLLVLVVGGRLIEVVY